MERTRESGVIRWKKIGGGSLRFPNRIIKPGEIFHAHPDDIPVSFRDTVVPLDKIPEDVDGEFLEVKDVEYEIKPRGYGGYFDVFNKNTGKQMNPKALREEAANELKAELEG